MARRKKYRAMAKRSYSRGLGIGKNFLMSGLFGGSGGIKGIAKSALVGIGAAVAVQAIPIQNQWKEEVAAGVAGGAPGFLAAYLLKQLGGTGTQSAGQW